MRLRFIALAAAALLLTAAGAALLAGEALRRPVHRVVGEAPADLDASTVTLPLASEGSGEFVRAWAIRAESAKAVVLLLHGVRSDRRQMLRRARFLRAAGYSTLLLDLPAHGESSGDRITFGARESRGVDAALSYLCASFPNQPIGVVGTSLGAAAFLMARRDCRPKAAVVESVYPTIEEATRDRLQKYLGPAGSALAPLLLLQIPLRTHIALAQLRPIDHIAGLGLPVLIASGSADRNTTPAETRRIYGAAREPKELWIVEGAGHVDLHDFAPAQYEARIGEFLAKYLR